MNPLSKDSIDLISDSNNTNVNVITDIQDFGLTLRSKGKVRNIYNVKNNRLFIISTDRVSAFDSVFNEGIPYKGIVLNQISNFWFEKSRHIIKNHVCNPDSYADINVAMPPEFMSRGMLVKKASVIPIESIVRGYLLGSAWDSYQVNKSVNGIPLPSGMSKGDRLEEPLFTPTTKEESGHDMAITEIQMRNKFGGNITNKIRDASLKLYKYAEGYSRSRGLILADTKFEFGVLNDEVILIDEALTPDSSRYLDKEAYDRGEILHFDKQYLRNYLESINWNKEPPVPRLPKEIVTETSKRYLSLYEKITGESIFSRLNLSR